METVAGCQFSYSSVAECLARTVRVTPVFLTCSAMTDHSATAATTSQPLADALRTATAAGAPLDAALWPHALTADEIIALHQLRAAEWGDRAHAPKYWKSGGVSRSQPLGHAPLPPQGVVLAGASGADLRSQPFTLRGIEAEIALRIGQDVDADLAAQLDEWSAASLIDAMAVSVEVVDSRWLQQLQAPDALKAADLLCHGALALGAWQAYTPRDWARQSCTVRIGQQALVQRQGSHSLQDPAWLLSAWLRYATQHFGIVRAGSVVTTGSWVGLLMAQAGDTVEATFDGVGQLHVQL